MSKPKPVNWQLIENTTRQDAGIYELVNNLKTQFHGGDRELSDLNFVLMWKHNIRPDQDGYIVIADVSKSSDKMRELRPHDVIIGINKIAWDLLDENQKKVVIDTQLERVVLCLDKEGNPKEDDKYRRIYRLKRPEVVDSENIVRRHGLTMSQVQDYVFNQLSGDFDTNSYADKVINGDADDE